MVYFNTLDAARDAIIHILIQLSDVTDVIRVNEINLCVEDMICNMQRA